MKRFTKLVESLETKKYYKISSEVDLIIVAENEGEAGYLADSNLGSIESHSDFRIINIEEITEDEFKQLKVTESVEQKDLTAEEKILGMWNGEFGNRNPTAIEKFEFYRKMRDSKYDADTIMDTLKEKICPDWANK